MEWPRFRHDLKGKPQEYVDTAYKVANRTPEYLEWQNKQAPTIALLSPEEKAREAVANIKKDIPWIRRLATTCLVACVVSLGSGGIFLAQNPDVQNALKNAGSQSKTVIDKIGRGKDDLLRCPIPPLSPYC